MRRFLPAAILLSSLLTPSLTLAQVRQILPNATDRNILDLQLQQQRTRSNTAENRVTRLAEIYRLEGRIESLSEKLDALAAARSGMRGLELLSLFDALAGRPSGSSTEPTKLDNASHLQSQRTAMLKLVAEDYGLGLEIDLTKAQFERLKTYETLRSTENLAAKGLASGPQLERDKLKHKQASLRVQRLEKLVAAYQNLIAPPETLPEPTPQPEPARSPAPNQP